MNIPSLVIVESEE